MGNKIQRIGGFTMIGWIIRFIVGTRILNKTAFPTYTLEEQREAIDDEM